MGRLNSLADVLEDWEELLEAVRRSPDLLPDVEEDVEILAGLLTRARQHKARQNEMTALRQEVTQKLNAELAQGKVTAIGMRAVVRGKIGPRSELLVQFGIAPLRKRRPVKSRPPEEPQGEEGLSLGHDSQEAPEPGAPPKSPIRAPPAASPPYKATAPAGRCNTSPSAEPGSGTPDLPDWPRRRRRALPSAPSRSGRRGPRPPSRR